MITLEMLLKIVGNDNLCQFNSYIYNGEDDNKGEFFYGKETIKNEYFNREVIDYWEDCEGNGNIVLRGE